MTEAGSTEVGSEELSESRAADRRCSGWSRPTYAAPTAGSCFVEYHGSAEPGALFWNIRFVRPSTIGPKGHPLEAETPAWAIHPSISPLPGEPVIRKKASDSFFETRLAELTEAAEINHLIIVGGMTEYCVDTTCRRAVTLGYDVTLVADAHLTRDTPVLTAAQIIAHHNLLLNGFAAGIHSIKVIPTDQVSLRNSPESRKPGDQSPIPT